MPICPSCGNKFSDYLHHQTFKTATNSGIIIDKYYTCHKCNYQFYCSKNPQPCRSLFPRQQYSYLHSTGQRVVRKWLDNVEGYVPNNSNFDRLCCACYYNDHSAVEALLNMVEDINQLNRNGTTPLSIACELGSYEAAWTLLTDPKINIHRANHDGSTPILIAQQNGHTNIVELLKYHFWHKQLPIDQM